MSRETAAFDIVQRLSPEISLRIRKRLRGKCRSLFDILRSQESFDGAAAIKAIPGMTAKDFPVYKSRMQQKVVDLLGEWHQKNRPDAKLALLLQRTHGYLEAGNTSRAIKSLLVYAGNALAFEVHDLQSQARLARMRLSAHAQEGKKAAAMLRKLDAAFDSLSSQSDEMNQAKAVLQRAFEIRAGRWEGREEAARDLLASALAPWSLGSVRANLDLCRAHWICNAILEDHLACIELSSQAISAIEARSTLLLNPDTLETGIAAANILSSELATRGNFEESHETLSKFQVLLVSALGFVPLEFQGKLRLEKMRREMRTGSVESALAAIRSTLKDPELTTASPKTVHVTAMIAIEYLLSVGRINETLPWLPILNLFRPRVQPPSRVIVGYLMELVCRIASGESEETLLAIRNLCYFAKARNCDTEYVGSMAKIFRDFAKKKTSETQLIMEAMQTTMDETHFRYLSYFDFPKRLRELKSHLEKHWS